MRLARYRASGWAFRVLPQSLARLSSSLVRTLDALERLQPAPPGTIKAAMDLLQQRGTLETTTSERLVKALFLNVGRHDSTEWSSETLVQGFQIVHTLGKTQLHDSSLLMLQILSEQLRRTPEEVFGAKETSSALSALCEVSSDSASAQHFLRTAFIRLKHVTLTASEIADCFIGLRSATEESEEVKDLLNLLADSIQVSDATWTHRHAAEVVCGLRCMGLVDISHPGKVMEALVPRLSSILGEIRYDDLIKLFTGLRNFGETSEAAVLLVEALINKIKSFQGHLPSDCIISGLKNFPAQRVVGVLPRLWRDLERTVEAQELTFRVAKNMAYLYNSVFINSLGPKVGDRYLTILKMLENRVNEQHKNRIQDFASNWEKRVYSLLKQRFYRKTLVTVSANQLILAFEMDIVIDIMEKQVGPFLVKINVELDGPSHNNANIRQLTKMRDSYLHMRHGIVVVRLPYNQAVCRNEIELVHAIYLFIRSEKLVDETSLKKIKEKLIKGT
jgi:very-short-patch-repair endonuclease